MQSDPPPEEVITIDHDDGIETVVLDDDTPAPPPAPEHGSQDDKSPHVPEKKARVGGSPTMAKGITAAGAWIGLALIQDTQVEPTQMDYMINTLG